MTVIKYVPLLLLVTLSSCNLMTSYEIDTTTTPNILVKDKMVDFLKTGKDSIITMYYEAIVHAEMIEELSRDTAETVIIPSNSAFRGLLKEAGYTSITEMNKGALRALLEYMIIPGRYVSYEMVDGVVNQVNSRTGDRIYISRNSSSTDGYVLYVNKVPSTDTELSATPLNVSRQDMVFKDKVAQVVDGFPRFLLKIPATDNAPAMGVRLNIEGDTHTWTSAAGANVYWPVAVQAGYRIDGSQNRTAMFLFEQKSVTQLSEISTATLNFYVIANGTKDPQVSSLKFYDISNEIDWTAYSIKTITKSFKPSLTDTTTLIKEATGISMPAAWYQLDLTDFIKSYYAKADRKQLFLAIRPSIKATTGNFSFGWKYEDDASRSINPAFIDITGPLESE
ncbi:MAG: fasciclin domain-containing protein, partial [Bacteroidia bacterium]|nr:fasciclin domain-containing protein [Bacteroidia bacterium]